MSKKTNSTIGWILVGLILVYTLSQAGLLNPFRTLTTVETSGHPKTNVVAEKISDDTEVIPGETYELKGNTHFSCSLTVDGAGLWVAGIWKALMEHYGVTPFYWKIEYYYVITKEGYPEGEWEWFISGTFQFTPLISKSITAVLLILLTSYGFWIGMGAGVGFLIFALGVVWYILRPIGDSGGPVFPLMAFIAILGAVVLILVFSGGKKRRR